MQRNVGTWIRKVGRLYKEIIKRNILKMKYKSEHEFSSERKFVTGVRQAGLTKIVIEKNLEAQLRFEV